MRLFGINAFERNPPGYPTGFEYCRTLNDPDGKIKIRRLGLDFFEGTPEVQALFLELESGHYSQTHHCASRVEQDFDF